MCIPIPGRLKLEFWTTFCWGVVPVGTPSAAGLHIAAMIENFIESVGGTKVSEAVDRVVKDLVVEEPSQLEEEENKDALFNDAFETYQKNSVAEERQREENRHIPRERGQLLCPNTFQLSPSDGGGSSVTVGFKMPMGEVVCRLYSGTRMVFEDFTLIEFVVFKQNEQEGGRALRSSAGSSKFVYIKEL